MFRKKLKIKSNSTLRGSSKKRLYMAMMKTFPRLTEEDLYTIFPRKENIFEVKIWTSHDKSATVFIVKQKPLLIEYDNLLIPTVFLLWSHPLLIRPVITHDCVLDIIMGGADLMIPGIISIASSAWMTDLFGSVKKGELISVCCESNCASVAVGVSACALTQNDIQKKKHGKAVVIYHAMNDEIYSLALLAIIQKPSLTLEDLEKLYQSSSSGKALMHTNEDSAVESLNEDTVVKCLNEFRLSESDENITKNIETFGNLEAGCNSNNIEPLKTEDYDNIMEKYVMIGLFNTPYESFPILTNVFFKSMFLANLPAEVDFDIKKTSYKKFSAYLKDILSKGIITLEDIKGVQKILSVNKEHALILQYKLFAKMNTPDSNQAELTKIIIKEHYQVTGPVAKLLSRRYSKGDIVSPQEIRESFTQYIRTTGLVNEKNPQFVTVNDEMKKVLHVKVNEMNWKDLYTKLFKLLKESHTLILPNGQTVTRNYKINPIEIKIASRSNKKKVTIVTNLANFGIDLKMFSHECQVAVAASSTICDVPGYRDPQFQVQGEHASVLRNLIYERYGVPLKYIVGVK